MSNYKAKQQKTIPISCYYEQEWIMCSQNQKILEPVTRLTGHIGGNDQWSLLPLCVSDPGEELEWLEYVQSSSEYMNFFIHLEATRVWAPVLSSNSVCNQKLQASEDIRQEQAHDSPNKIWAVMSRNKIGHWSHDPHTLCGCTRLSFPPCESSDWLLGLEEHQVQSSWVWCSTSTVCLKLSLPLADLMLSVLFG